MAPLDRRQLLALAAAALASGCRRRQGRRAAPRRAEGPLPAPAARIVSLAPAVTETLFALGAGPRVVGVSELCDRPPEVARLPRVGTMASPAAAALRALRPDAVAGTEGPVAISLLEPLRADGVRMVFPRMETLADVRRSFDALASLGGVPDAAEALRRRMDEGVDRVRRAVAGARRPKVLAVYSQSPLVIAGPGSWAGEVLAVAGGDNAALNANRYPMVSIEQVQGFAPEVLLDLTWREGAPPLVEAWAEHAAAIPALASRRVIRLEDPSVVRQGPRFAEAAALVARALHPGARV